MRLILPLAFCELIRRKARAGREGVLIASMAISHGRGPDLALSKRHRERGDRRRGGRGERKREITEDETCARRPWPAFVANPACFRCAQTKRLSKAHSRGARLLRYALQRRFRLRHAMEKALLPAPHPVQRRRQLPLLSRFKVGPFGNRALVARPSARRPFTYGRAFRTCSSHASLEGCIVQ